MNWWGDAPRCEIGQVSARGRCLTSRNTVAVCRWNSHAQYALHGHCMTAIPPVMEETTGAMPLPIIIGRGVCIVLASERRFKASELNAFWFFCVPFGFSDLVDHA